MSYFNAALAELDHAATALELSIMFDYAITALVMLITVYIFFHIYQSQLDK